MKSFIHPLIPTILVCGSAVGAIGAVVAAADFPDATVAIQRAAESSYEAVVLVLIVLTTFGLFTWAVRCWIVQAAAREDRLSQRVTTLEDKITDRLLTTLDKSSDAINHNSDSLRQINEVLTGISAQMERFSDGVLQLEMSIRDHDAKVEEHVARAAGIRNG
jgi:pimeloyl-ACP methyl ester carboxylesterase